LLLAIAGCGDTNQVEVTDYRPPQAEADGLADDKLADKTVPDFDPQLIDRRPLEGWLVNSSAAVVEPAATYYLRTARAYAFLAGFLESTLDHERLVEMHGLTAKGARTPDLWTGLIGMRDLFYGLYLVSADDIGLKISFLADEMLADSAECDRCHELALDWLSHAYDDPDLAVDTRVSVPIYIDRQRGTTRLWMTIGVRLTRLVADYARQPLIKPASGEGDWKEPKTLGESHYLIAVDEFAEVELPGLRVLNREERRAICDRAKTKEAILRSLETR
jgi:hypothetical protein